MRSDLPWAPEWVERICRFPAAPGGSALFVSDLHFGAGPDPDSRIRDFLRLADSLPGRIERLVLGGDAFEFWWEWKGASSSGGHERFLTTLADLVRAGVAVEAIAGNHDFALGDRFAERCGARIHRDGFCLDYPAGRWLFLHGDAMVPGDRLDRGVRRLLRAPIAQRLWGLLPPDLSLRLASGVGAGSRALQPGPASNIGEYEPCARGWMRCFGLAGVVHGHTHRPLLTIGSEGTYANNGDWIARRDAILVDASGRAQALDFAHEESPWLSST